eukprot:365696-Chlamydomonas_euryale.AAC.10
MAKEARPPVAAYVAIQFQHPSPVLLWSKRNCFSFRWRMNRRMLKFQAGVSKQTALLGQHCGYPKPSKLVVAVCRSDAAQPHRELATGAQSRPSPVLGPNTHSVNMGK